MRYFLLLFVSVFLYSSDRVVLIANKNFPVKHLSKDQIRQIYLKRMRFIKDLAIVPINYTAQDPLRKNFEKIFLNMTHIQLSRYWIKEHYLGRRPPVVQHSVKSVIVFIKKVDGAVGYVPNSKLPDDVLVLYVSKEK